MKKQFFETEKDGFYGTYYENPKGSDCAVIGLFGDDPNDYMAKCGVKWLHKNGVNALCMSPDKVQDQKVRESIASQTSTYELDWKFHYEKGVDEFYNTYTECGICKLGKRENCFEFVPCLCNMDERNYRNEGGQLHRTKTLAQGDECCNFHVTRIK